MYISRRCVDNVYHIALKWSRHQADGCCRQMASKRIQKELQVTDRVLCRLADAKSWAGGSEPPCCIDEFDKSAQVSCCDTCAGFTERPTDIMLSRTCRRRPLSLAGRACCFSKCQVTSCNTADGQVARKRASDIWPAGYPQLIEDTAVSAALCGL